MVFHEIKIELTKLANQLFVYTCKKVKKDIDLNGKFDYIGPDVHGVMSFSPKEQFEAESLNYNRDEQGRDYFSSFLTLAIQCGVKLGFDQKQKEVDEVKEKFESREQLIEIYNREIATLQNQVSVNLMPKGSLEDEIRELRNKLTEANKTIQDLSAYKRIVDTMQKSLSFIKND